MLGTTAAASMPFPPLTTPCLWPFVALLQLEALLAAAAPPSVIVPSTFDVDELVAQRVAKEFSWSPPPKEAKEGGEEEEEEEEMPEPTAEELAEMEEEAKNTYQEEVSGQVNEEKERFDAVVEAATAAGVRVLPPVLWSGPYTRRFAR